MSILSHGKPVVTTTGVFTEPLWQSRQAVVLAPADDTNAFVDAAVSAMDTKGLGEAGKRFYDECFHIDRAVELLRRASVPRTASFSRRPSADSLNELNPSVGRASTRAEVHLRSADRGTSTPFAKLSVAEREFGQRL